MKVRVEARVYPSEDPGKVAEAVENIFPAIDLEESEDFVRGVSEDLNSLENFKNLLGLQAIRDSARSVMKEGSEGNKLFLNLNKQVATVNKVNFSGDDAPLGPIRLTIQSDDIDDVIDFLTLGENHRD